MRKYLSRFMVNKNQGAWTVDEKPDLLVVYKVMLPTWVLWPGKVTLNISYTYQAAQQFIEDYPNKFLTPWMTIETQEIISYRETD
jgi:hypothetical protein